MKRLDKSYRLYAIIDRCNIYEVETKAGLKYIMQIQYTPFNKFFFEVEWVANTPKKDGYWDFVEGVEDAFLSKKIECAVNNIITKYKKS